MPYIPVGRRKNYYPLIARLWIELDKHNHSTGDYAYIITSLLRHFLEIDHWDNKMDAIKILEGVKLEIYRRKLKPYEDKKIMENEDVF